ncbi:hypothetical protein [Pseudomonas syringae]|uniref:hypothetical protein n=1 Tax=Pseudomonas syringae TaxID=317 RepID=UPI003D65F481
MQNNSARAQSTLDVARSAVEALEEITRSVGEISDRHLAIASAAEEQAKCIGNTARKSRADN